MAIAFFDLDKTLLCVNSATLWVRFEVRNGLMPMRHALKAMGWLLRYRLGDVALDTPIRQSILTLRGKSEAELEAKTAAFYANEVKHLYRPGALEALERHRQAGDTLVLLSSTTEYLAKIVQAQLGLHDRLCTRFEVDAQGHFTGIPLEPLCFGPGKLVAAQAYCTARNISLSACTFYSDSYSDVPVFAAVGHPVAINPDAPLRRHARKRGWQVLDWGRPALAIRRKGRVTVRQQEPAAQALQPLVAQPEQAADKARPAQI